MQRAAKAYLQTQVTTTNQGQILLMLYDAAINFLKQAQERMAEKDYAKKGILISKALDILTELASSLNVQKGGELAENLGKLYFFCSTQLLQANLKMDQNKVAEVVKILTSLRSAWQQVVENGGATAPQPVSVAAPAAQPAPVAQAEPTAQPAPSQAENAAAADRTSPDAAPAQSAPEAAPVPLDAPAAGPLPSRARLLKAYTA